ncbi:MAG: class I SAM-dependent methyltransferase [Methylotetracoccus sp.]
MQANAYTAQGKAMYAYCSANLASTEPRRVLSIRATAPEPLNALAGCSLECLQTDRVYADRLQATGLAIVTNASGPFDLGLVEATKHRDENHYHVALAWSLLREAGELVCVAANSLGGESLAKRLVLAGFPVLAVESKAKCRIIRIRRDAGRADPETLADWLALGDYRRNADGLLSCPGSFSHHAVDAGTKLLCDTLPLPLRGRGADFGAGYGALSLHIARGSPDLKGIDLYEAEWKALEAARRNLSDLGGASDIAYHWQDITRLKTTRRYDWIAMNPPFHAGREAVPSLGRAFIARAAEALSPGGTLFLVANRHLPYEETLAEHFAEVVPTANRDGFKTISARGLRAPGRR